MVKSVVTKKEKCKLYLFFCHDGDFLVQPDDSTVIGFVQSVDSPFTQLTQIALARPPLFYKEGQKQH